VPNVQDITLAPVRVGTDTADEVGRLVFAEDRLVAVLVRLAEGHDEAGHWFLEHGFGRLGVPVPPTFSDLQAAEIWIASRLSGVADGEATSTGRSSLPAPRTLS
jgi:hypothetical protein